MNSLSVMRRRMAAWAVLCGATAALLGMTPAVAQTLKGQTDAVDVVPGVQLRTGETLRVTGYSALRAKAAQSPRKVRVIARMSAFATGDGPSGEPLRAIGETPAIRGARDQLVMRLRARGAEAVEGLADTSLVVMEVDAAQLDALVANGEVAELTEDVPVPPTLAESGPLVRAPQAHALGARGAGTTVAILDTGVQSNHPFLTGRVVEEACFSTTSAANNSTSFCPGGASSSTAAGSGAACGISGCDHGTHVAGIAAGRATGATTFNGMAPDANIMAVQVFSRFTDSPGNTPCASQGRASPCILSFTSDQIRGLQRVLERRAARNIVAANMSLGGGVNAAACDADARKDVIDDLLAVRVATVIASGNNGSSTGVSAPGCISTAVTVGSTTKADAVSSFSNSSTLVDILAPGSSINSSITGSGFGVKSGTSMATPHVVGAFAAIRSMVPGANVNDILGALQATGVAITDSRNGVTRRRINLEAAVNQLAPQPFALSAGMLFQMHADGRIWAHTGVACSGTSCPGWVLLDANPATRAIAAGGNALYQLHADGKVWRYTGVRCGGASCPGWQMLDNNPATKQIAAGGTSLYQRHADGKIWRSTGAACSGNSCPGWTKLDANPHTKSLAAAGGQLYQLHDTGAIWRSTGVACSGNSCPGWTMFDNNPAAREIAANVGGLFQRHADGKIWRSTGAACSGNSCPGWTMLDNNGATVQIEASTSGLFQRHSNGRIWRSTGAACSGNSCPGWVMLDNNPATSTIVTAQP